MYGFGSLRITAIFFIKKFSDHSSVDEILN